LRRKIDDRSSTKLIHTFRGMGYSVRADENVAPGVRKVK
jgi:DNA-binding response OmpR family regulator